MRVDGMPTCACLIKIESMGEKYNERLQQAKDEINKTIRVGERVTIWNPSRVEGVWCTYYPDIPHRTASSQHAQTFLLLLYKCHQAWQVKSL